MRLALSSSDSHVGALGDVTPLASRSVFAAQPVALGVLFAARIFANAALSPVLDANSSLDDTVRASFYFAPLALRPMSATGACFIYFTSCRTTGNRAPFKLLLRLCGCGGGGG